MGLFSSSTEKSTLAQYPVNPDVTRQHGSGAEQDRYGSHFSLPPNALDKGIDKVKQAAQYKGEGAEQDRHAAHFGVGSKGHDTLKAAARYQGEGAEQDRYHAHFDPILHSRDAMKVKEAARNIVTTGSIASWSGLGYDGQQRAKMMAGGSGAEQDRLGSHLRLDRDTVASAAQSVKDGAKDMLPKK